MSTLASQIVSAKLQTVFGDVRTKLDTISANTGLTFHGFLLKSTLEQSTADSGVSFASALSMDSESNEKVVELLNEMIQSRKDEAQAKLDEGLAVNAETAVVPAENGDTAAAVSLLPATQYDALILEAAEAHGVEPALVKALIYGESGFRADAKSGAGAMGLMQLMPYTAEALAVSDPYDPAANIDGGTRLLCSLLDRYDGDARKAIAAYNLGAGGFDSYNLTDLSSEAQFAQLPSETRALLTRIGNYLDGAGAGGVLG